MDRLSEAKRVFDVEIDALLKTRDALNDDFLKILDLIIECNGKVVVTGMGKPGHIAAKIAATLSSLGTPSFCLHPAEAMHGDLGMVSKNDIVIAISYSGESDEIVKILPNLKMIGATLIGITGNKNSTLAHASDVVQVLPPFHEACYLGLAPTSSTTAELCYGDALAVVASAVYGFKDIDFGRFHPAGLLGKKLLVKVSDLMMKESDTGIAAPGTLLQDVLPQMGKSRGIVSIVDQGILQGVFTDGDLRRVLSKHKDIYSVQISDIMTNHPIVIEGSKLAVNALQIMNEKDIAALPVVDAEKYVGVIHIKDITGFGICV